MVSGVNVHFTNKRTTTENKRFLQMIPVGLKLLKWKTSVGRKYIFLKSKNYWALFYLVPNFRPQMNLNCNFFCSEEANRHKTAPSHSHSLLFLHTLTNSTQLYTLCGKSLTPIHLFQTASSSHLGGTSFLPFRIRMAFVSPLAKPNLWS